MLYHGRGGRDVFTFYNPPYFIFPSPSIFKQYLAPKFTKSRKYRCKVSGGKSMQEKEFEPLERFLNSNNPKKIYTSEPAPLYYMIYVMELSHKRDLIHRLQQFWFLYEIS